MPRLRLMTLRLSKLATPSLSSKVKRLHQRLKKRKNRSKSRRNRLTVML